MPFRTLGQRFYAKQGRRCMILEHRGRRPNVHHTAYVAPNAVLCGDVKVGEGSRVMFGVVLSPPRAGRWR